MTYLFAAATTSFNLRLNNPDKKLCAAIEPTTCSQPSECHTVQCLVASNSGRAEFKSRYMCCCTSCGPNRLFITVCTTVHYFFSVLSHIHPDHVLQSHSITIRFNTIVTSASRSSKKSFSPQVIPPKMLCALVRNILKLCSGKNK